MSSVFAVLLILTLIIGGFSMLKPGKSKKTGETYRRKDLGLGFGVFAVIFFILFGLTSPSPKAVNVEQAGLKATTSQQSQAETQTPTVTTKQETETQSVPYTTQNQNDSSLAQGQTKIIQQGQNGTETLTYNVTYSDGTQTNKTLVSTTVTAQPVTQIVAVGTYVAPAQPTCTNGTYVNSAGNTVCSPETASSAPAGATAQCVDGTYSFSQTHSGTCSHHGGVAEWL